MVCVLDRREAWEGEVWQVPVLEGRVDIRTSVDIAPGYERLLERDASGHEIGDD